MQYNIMTLNSELKTTKVTLKTTLYVITTSVNLGRHAQIRQAFKRILGKLLTQTNTLTGWRRLYYSCKYLVCKYHYPTISSWIPTCIYSSSSLIFVSLVFISEIKPVLLITNHPCVQQKHNPNYVTSTCQSHHNPLHADTSQSYTFLHEQKLCSCDEMIWFEPVRIYVLIKL